MKIFKLVITVIFIAFILFAGSCATKKKTFKDIPVPEGDTSMLVDLEEVAQPVPDYPEEEAEQFELSQAEEAEEVLTEAEEAEEVTEIEELAEIETIEEPEVITETINIAANPGSEGLGSEGLGSEGTPGAANSSYSGSQVSTGRAFGSHGGPGGKERRNNNLAGAGSVNVEGVMDYIKIRNRNPMFNEENARKIINSYVDEAVKEDINYDFAIAQMLYWTAFLTVKDRVESNNLAGLQSSKNWNGKFSTMEEGVQAHIQHLRGYSHKTLKSPNTKIVDPRWEHIGNSRGTVKNFEQIYPRWSASSERYRRNIILILNDMYRYSDRYSSLYR